MTTNSNPPHDVDALTMAGGDLMGAEKIIERFGGIRPMATKMNVPVTTVQGWKKRNVIPANRRAEVLAAARTHNIDLSGLNGDDAPVQQGNDFARNMNAARVEQNTNPESLKPHEQALAAARATEEMEARQRNNVTHEAMMKEIEKVRTQAVRRSVVAAFAVVSLFVVGSGLLIAVGKQKVDQNAARLAELEKTVDTARDVPSAGVIEGSLNDISNKFNDLRGRTDELQASVATLKQQAESMLNLDSASLADRLMTLEQKLQALTGGNTDLSLVLQRVQDMQASLQGQEKMQAAMGDLQGLIGGLQGRMDNMDTALAEEQQSDSALGQALEGVSPQELKAAAMLIGLSQFRDSMNRSGPFADDLALLQTMLGEKDPELSAEISRLAPYAEKGVLSPKGLSNELKGLAGDIVVSSISGEDLSIQDKALTRFHDVLKIQKNGQPISGNDTQAAVARAQLLLDSGDVDGALVELQTLKGPARETAQPIIDQAQITAMAQNVQNMLTNTVMTRIKLGGSGSAPLAVRASNPANLMGPYLAPKTDPITPAPDTETPAVETPVAPLDDAPLLTPTQTPPVAE